MLANATSILALVALLVAAVAVAYSALTRTTIATLKESNGALTERVALLEKAAALDLADKARLAAEITTVTAERDTIARVVTGEVHLVAIEHQLEDHHTAAEGWWGTLAAELTLIRQALEATP